MLLSRSSSFRCNASRPLVNSEKPIGEHKNRLIPLPRLSRPFLFEVAEQIPLPSRGVFASIEILGLGSSVRWLQENLEMSEYDKKNFGELP
jgi:hypothetical protein